MNNHLPPSLRLATLAAVFAMVWAPSARTQNVERIAEREVIRRQNGIGAGEAALARGRAAMQANELVKAHDEFRIAVNYLPDAVATGTQHDAAVKGFCESGVRLAEWRIKEGKYGEAEQIAREILDDRYDPNCHAAIELLKHLQQPGYYNKTMGPKFIAKVEEVTKTTERRRWVLRFRTLRSRVQEIRSGAGS